MTVPQCASADAPPVDLPPVAGSPTEPPALSIESPFVDHLGVRLVSAADGASEAVLLLAPQHLNTWHVAHGGVTMTLADVALAMAARSLAEAGAGVVTVEMKLNFMQPGRGELRAQARVLHRSKTMAYCEGEIRDSNGHFVAKALGTFKYMRRLAVGREVMQQRVRGVVVAPGSGSGLSANSSASATVNVSGSAGPHADATSNTTNTSPSTKSTQDG